MNTKTASLPFRLTRTALLALALVGLGACESRTDRTDGGGVLLTVSDFDELPIAVSVNATGAFVQVGEIVIRNIAKDPTGVTSELMSVELETYEVVYRRLDRGQRVPPPYVRGIFGIVPVNGTTTLENLPVVGPEQLTTPPLSDLLFINGGFDKETGSNVISLELRLTFFGRTLSGDRVRTEPITWAIEFTP